MNSFNENSPQEGELTPPRPNFEGDLLSDALVNSTVFSINSDEMRIFEIDPARCKPWKFHNRDIAWLTKERCLDLMLSIQKNGQLEPALVRRIQNDPKYDFEIIYGVRRWFVCSQIPDQKLLARITTADDKTCMILMHTENADSKDISDFERACSFSQQMKSGMFKNQTEMAEAMNLSQGTISKMIKAAEIFEHKWIESLFHNKLDIPIKHAYSLSILLKKNETYDCIKREAEIMRTEKVERPLSATAILKRLIAQGKPNLYKSTEPTFLTVNNKPIVSFRQDKLGKFYIVIENHAKDLNYPEIEAACVKAIKDYLSA
jgi:ParB family chromosome partitioning protein